eukprot:m.38116 g.38116  ORF g.38116 m.38116 type:complete len:550 (+) comp32526_c0_seq6:2350-3999(+)
MADAWKDIHVVRRHRQILKERLAVRRKELKPAIGDKAPFSVSKCLAELDRVTTLVEATRNDEIIRFGPKDEQTVLEALLQLSMTQGVPFEAGQLYSTDERRELASLSRTTLGGILDKMHTQNLIVLSKEDDSSDVKITAVEDMKIQAILEVHKPKNRLEIMLKESGVIIKKKRSTVVDKKAKAVKIRRLKDGSLVDINAYIDLLLTVPSARESESRKMGDEIQELLTTPSVKEQRLMEKFKSQGGTQVREFCTFGTKDECMKQQGSRKACVKVHFRKIIGMHTDITLGDCSFLNTCFHMETCKYIHYAIDMSDERGKRKGNGSAGGGTAGGEQKGAFKMTPAQWVQCDIRSLDYNVLGKFAVIMADPPWDIHMELPYGTMSDTEMRSMDIPTLQDDGYIFLWVTGRAMELGRDLLDLWGYQRADELIWVKTNQLQRLIRTGRTGHWLNHAKEHCLIGKKGNVDNFNRGIDCDVVVAEVRDTSHKPDEIYGIIERLAPGMRKIELFGRHHNVQPNWVTLGNQLNGVHIVDPEMVTRFKEKYPDGNCMKKN